MIGRRHDHGVHRLVIENAPQIGHGSHRVDAKLLGGHQTGGSFVHVAHISQFDPGVLQNKPAS